MTFIQAHRQKLRRLASGKSPRLLDLFAGCGGISLGFEAAGFEILGGAEIDPLASLSHAQNFFRQQGSDAVAQHGRPVDITEEEPDSLVRHCGSTETAALAVDVIAGGPPCQAFARVGRAKLREIAEHPDAFKLDARGNLYLRYLHYVRQLKPLALLMENVPDIINYGGHNVPAETCEALESIGYVARYTLLNSAYYGVPQMRERMFLLAFSKEVADSVCFPKPSHWIELPQGYAGTRGVALRYIREDLFSGPSYYIDPPQAAPYLPHAISAQEAIGDLPAITAHLEGELKRGARRFDQLTRYGAQGEVTAYAKLMRSWPGHAANDGVYDHVIRSLPRDYAIFARMQPGDQYPEAHVHALALFEQRLAQAKRDTGQSLAPHSKSYQELFAATVPPYDPGKFPNKWRKMEADLPARTLLAHLGKDGYSHIHYDSRQARTISVREAARLQSFPDGFVFSGTMNPAFRQIGNAVPPLMAQAIAQTIKETLQQKL
jgi:DNA (cytosine-5)-methyltransferase 1